MICPDRVPDPKVTRIDDIVKLGLYDCEVREIAEAMQHNENVRTWHKTNWGKAPQKEIDRLFAYLKIRAYADRCDLVFDDFTALSMASSYTLYKTEAMEGWQSPTPYLVQVKESRTLHRKLCTQISI